MEDYEAIDLINKLFSCEVDNFDEAVELLESELGVDYETFEHIVNILLPLTPTVKTVFTDKEVHSFIDANKGVMIVRKDKQ